MVDDSLLKPLDGMKVLLCNDTVLLVASFLKMPGEYCNCKTLEKFRLVSKRIDHVVKSQCLMLQQQLIGDLVIDIVSLPYAQRA